MPIQVENAPEKLEKNAPTSHDSPDTSTSSTPITPLTNSTLSTPSSLYSTSPDPASFFRFVSENEFELERTAFPREQTLLDLLIHSSGAQNTHQLRQLREVKLRVISSTISLSRLAFYCSNLRVLNLDGSSLTSLREIGTMLTHLKVLHVSKCGLTGLDGTFGLTSLTELYAADNYIDNVGPCTVLENIKIIILDSNPLRSLGNVTLLSLCPNLVKLSMKRTPVSRISDYKKIIKEFMPNLKRLDGDFLNGQDSVDDSMEVETQDESFKSIDGKSNKSDETTSCSIEVSSLTEASCEDNENQSSTSSSEFQKKCGLSMIPICSGSNIACRRPATALGVSSFTTNIQTLRRPKTALSNRNCKEDSNQPIFSDTSDSSPSSLTSGGIVCGNITRALSRARPPQKPPRPSSSKPVDPWIIGPSIRNEKEPDRDASIAIISDISELHSSRSIIPKDHLEIIEEVKRIIMEPLPSKPDESTPVIDLELGITGSVSPEYSPEDENRWEHDSSNALDISKRWRRAFKLYRRKHKINLTRTMISE